MGHRKTAFTVVFLLVVVTLFAQKKETELKGYLGVEGGESYTYRLSFTDSSGFIKGYSYTYLQEGKEVKASITGFIDKKNKTFSFKETSIIYNHGFESSTVICLINAALQLKIGNDGTEVYAGPITSSDIGNVYCGQGTVSFPASQTINELFQAAQTEPVEQKAVAAPKPARPVKIMYDTVREAKDQPVKTTPHYDEPEKITAGTEKVIEWHSENIVLEIWDGGKIDGDVVTLSFNASVILKQYALTKDPKRITIPVSKNNSIETLSILANAEGNEPPNTANLLLIDGNRKYPIVAYNIIGKKAIIKIKRVQQ